MSLPAFRAAKVTISKLRYVRCRSDPANSDGFSQSYMGRGFRVGHPFPRSLTLLQPFQIKEILGTSDLSPRAATLVFREEREMPASSEPGLDSWEDGHRFSPTITASASHAPILGRDTMSPSRVARHRHTGRGHRSDSAAAHREVRHLIPPSARRSCPNTDTLNGRMLEVSPNRANSKRDGYNAEYQRYDHAYDGSDSHT